ncbi:unnamed protein product, partial [Rhizoctonia solani]
IVDGVPVLSVPCKQTLTTEADHLEKDTSYFPNGILKLPVELFVEITKRLLPVDLLAISRTCKAFRGVLMPSSSERIWQRAIGNQNRFPPAPPWLSVQQYISILYSNFYLGSEDKPVSGQQLGAPVSQHALLIQLCVLSNRFRRLAFSILRNIDENVRERMIKNFSKRIWVEFGLDVTNGLLWGCLYVIMQVKATTQQIWSHLYPEMKGFLEGIENVPKWNGSAPG